MYTQSTIPIIYFSPMQLDKIFRGNSREVLEKMSNNSVDLIVTSPPYADSRIGIEILKEYCDITELRLSELQAEESLSKQQQSAPYTRSLPTICLK